MSELMAQVPSYQNLFLGGMGGCIGEISGIALILGFMYMLYKKIVTWHTATAVLGTMFVLNGILWLINPDRFADPMFHILAGGALLGALYMATDYATSPMTTRGMLIYGVGIGLITTVIRVFGSYPEGMAFAILIMNGFVPLINKYVKPKRFGLVKNG
jgi:electron transport complex protein RnfD